MSDGCVHTDAAVAIGLREDMGDRSVNVFVSVLLVITDVVTSFALVVAADVRL